MTTENSLLAEQRALAQARAEKFGPPPPDRETWLSQLDEIAKALNVENIYRRPQPAQPEQWWTR